MSGDINMLRVSDHFMLREFQCRCCGRVMLSARLVELLEALREAAGRPLVLTSGYRCEAHNARVGGAPRSRHMSGRAVDIATPQPLQAAEAQAARELGFTEVIAGGARGYLHVAI